MTTDNTLTGPNEPDFDWSAAERDLATGIEALPHPRVAPEDAQGLADMLGTDVDDAEEVCLDCAAESAEESRIAAEAAAEAAREAAAEAVAAVREADALAEAVRDVDDVLEGLDSDADAHLWPVMVDEKGRPTTETAMPNPVAMRLARRRAEATSEADVDALAEAISEPEAREIIHRAADLRGFERDLDAKVARRRAELASRGARLQAEHEASVADARRRQENRLLAALERQDRALDPTTAIVRLAAAERWVPMIAILPAVLAAVLGAVNVGVSLDHLSPSTHVINWLLEPLLTLPVIAILLAQVLGAIGDGDKNPFRNLEYGLIVVALFLNVGLHVAVDGLTPAAAVWAIVPAGLAISASLVPKLIRSLRQALADAVVEPPAAAQKAFRTAPAAVAAGAEYTRTEGVLDQVTPESRSDEELVVELAEAVRDGRIDPQTGRAVNPASAESIRRTLNIAKKRAPVLRDAYAKLAAS
ncbi:hypothetical protein [Glycomyces artemisiae]|uniref:Uncharacterized protein n=1 Tax=Glycomyces artemisiae TaxID=1076443 RepID=A0A2T0U6N7_9ACTN|nr:hypothetical protein [Glycomyces artemisiae]PRY53528.1 hypothetical protein B0I28_11727 [Glycomyces artemisiae]